MSSNLQIYSGIGGRGKIVPSTHIHQDRNLARGTIRNFMLMSGALEEDVEKVREVLQRRIDEARLVEEKGAAAQYQLFVELKTIAKEHEVGIQTVKTAFDRLDQADQDFYLAGLERNRQKRRQRQRATPANPVTFTEIQRYLASRQV